MVKYRKKLKYIWLFLTKLIFELMVLEKLDIQSKENETKHYYYHSNRNNLILS